MAVKAKSATFDTVLERAEKAKSLQPLETFVLECSHQLNMCDDSFGQKASANIMQWWHRGTRGLQFFGVDAQLAYFRDFRVMYKGRGFPLPYDGELANRAMGSARPAQEADGSTKGTNKDASKMDEKLDKLVEATSALGTTVGQLAGSLKTIQGEVASLKKKVSGEEEGGELRCNYCKQLGHVKANCPKLQGKEEGK